MSDEATTVDFWFDPLCPWAWMTSRWMKEVEAVRGVTTRFHLMSLGYLNADKDIDDEYREKLKDAWGPVRVCAAAADRYGDDVLDSLYTELGTRIHNEDRGADREVIEDALKAAGLDVSLADAMDSDKYDDKVIASHTKGIELVGLDVGTPVISVEGVAFFGPVVTPIPRGETAGTLWDGVRMVAGIDGFYELKRSRTAEPSFA